MIDHANSESVRGSGVQEGLDLIKFVKEYAAIHKPQDVLREVMSSYLKTPPISRKSDFVRMSFRLQSLDYHRFNNKLWRNTFCGLYPAAVQKMVRFSLSYLFTRKSRRQEEWCLYSDHAIPIREDLCILSINRFDHKHQEASMNTKNKSLACADFWKQTGGQEEQHVAEVVCQVLGAFEAWRGYNVEMNGRLSNEAL